MKVVWTELAFERLAEIEEYIAFDNPRAAEELSARLIERTESLARFPELGRLVPEVPESGFRELIDGNYRIVYRVKTDAVEVMTVFEAHRLLPLHDLSDQENDRV